MKPLNELYDIIKLQQSIRVGRLKTFVTDIHREISLNNIKIKLQQETIEKLNKANNRLRDKNSKLKLKVKSVLEESQMKKVEHDLLTNKHTTVLHENEEEIQFNAPHHFYVYESGINIGDSVQALAEVHFQEGPIGEYGVNGVMNEDLITMVISRLQHFQKSDFSCRENAMAITKLEESLLWLRKRTMSREQRGVIGTSLK